MTTALATDPAAPSVPDAPRAAQRMRRGFPALRPLSLGLFAYAEALTVTWVAYDRAVPSKSQPGDHVWWHSSGGADAHAGHAASAQAGGAGVFLALAAAALYLLLPLTWLIARGLRRRGIAGPGVQVLFALAATVAAGVVHVPVTMLATALSPAAGGPVWPAVAADTVAVLRLGAPVALLLLVAAGVPWGPRGSDAPSPQRESPSC